MSIKFYSMGKRCGHCVNTEKNILKKEIAAGKVVVLPASQAPKGKFQGFPAFVSDLTGKSSMGAPKSYNQLAKKFDSDRLVHVDDTTLLKLMNNEQAMEVLMKIEGFRNINQDIEKIINKFIYF